MGDDFQGEGLPTLHLPLVPGGGLATARHNGHTPCHRVGGYHLNLDCQFHCGGCTVAAQEADPGRHGLSNALLDLVQPELEFHQSAVRRDIVIVVMHTQLNGARARQFDLAAADLYLPLCTCIS